MPNYGATHSARGDINTIRNNLLEGQQQQTGLMFILKEIVQNADDCKATRLSICRSEGLPTAAHPLLQGPAIIAVNDGPFSKRDAKGIRAIGLSTKENDSSAVGKFGQGLKTVFLLCEAFFYLSGSKREDGVEPRSILNLWYTEDEDDDVPRADWDRKEFSQADHDLINAELESMGISEGFMLWIPLRLRDHCQRSNYTNPIAIIPRYFDDEPEWLATEFQAILAHELAELLPLLKHIKHIQVHDGQTLQEVQLNDDAERCLASFDPSPLELKSPLNGLINLGDKDQEHSYYGYQELLNVEELLSLKKSENWPTVIPTRWDAEVAEKQKAEPHCAVVLHVRPSPTSTSKLLIRWAVFLPTAEMPDGAPITEISITTPGQEAAYHYVLTLHGFFFLQGDRRRIRDWSSDGSKNEVLQTWNKILAEQGTLRLLLPTLEEFSNSRSAQAVKEFTDALRQSSIYKTYKAYICAEGSWVYTVDFKVHAHSRWRVLKSREVLLAIPQSTFGLLPEIFPNLEEVCGDRIITFEEWPQLTNKSKISPWKISDIVQLLQGAITCAPKTCADGDRIQALDTFLSYSKRNLVDRVVEELKKTAASGIY